MSTFKYLALGFCASACFAQVVPVPLPAGEYRMSENVRFMSAEFGVEGKTVKGAPYSAQAVTETTQTLADGNRIVNKSSTAIARDGEGRTRREQNIKGVGPWATGETAPSLVFINDPASQVGYVLETNTHTARKTTLSTSSANSANEALHKKLMAEIESGGAVGSGAMHTETITVRKMVGDGEAPVVMAQVHNKAADEAMAMESLGSKMIEGVRADGKRFTRTVPAGEMGNEKPMAFVNEVWTSPELQVTIMSRHSDPQAGETVYTLTNIRRSEPDPALFSVPADYTVTDGPRQFIIQKHGK